MACCCSPPQARRSGSKATRSLVNSKIADRPINDGRDRIQWWRRGPESNWADRICNPGHNRFATAPLFLLLNPGFHISQKKGKHRASLLRNWSGRRGSNSRPQPWQGCALPTELLPHFRVRFSPCREDAQYIPPKDSSARRGTGRISESAVPHLAAERLALLLRPAWLVRHRATVEAPFRERLRAPGRST